MTVKIVVALLIGVAAAFVLGCGDKSNLIGSADSVGLQDELTNVQNAIASGNCSRATKAANDFEEQARNLPESIDAGLRARIREGAASLVQRAPIDCRQRTVTTDTDTTDTQTETTTTTTTPTTTTTTVPTVPTIPTTIPSTLPSTNTTGGTGGTGGTGVGGTTP